MVCRLLLELSRADRGSLEPVFRPQAELSTKSRDGVSLNDVSAVGRISRRRHAPEQPAPHAKKAAHDASLMRLTAFWI